MANFKLTQTGEQIQADLDLLDSNSATSGQVLTADGAGGASWQNASGGSDNALVKPDSAPSSTSLVAVDETNAQTMLTVGDGLSVENGALKATGGTGGTGGGTKLYFHFFGADIDGSGTNIKYFVFASTSSEQYDGENYGVVDVIPYLFNDVVSGLENVCVVIGLSYYHCFSISLGNGPSLQSDSITNILQYTVTPL